MYAGKSQKYTSACPKYQNNVRVRLTFMRGTKSNAQGMINTTTETATARLACSHKIIVAIVIYANKGEGLPRFFLRQRAYAMMMPIDMIHEPTINRARPT